MYVATHMCTRELLIKWQAIAFQVATLVKHKSWKARMDPGQDPKEGLNYLFGVDSYQVVGMCFIALSYITILIFCACVCLSVCVFVPPEISGMGGCIAMLLTPS